MKVSIIIPTYKPGEYLWECLDSIKSQTFDTSSFEVLLILNGCKEPYFTQIKQYISNNLNGINLKFFYTDVKGVSNARNIGLDNAKGLYISFIDDDDLISPSYLEELYDVSNINTISISNVIAFNDPDLTDKELHYEKNLVFKKIITKGNIKFYKAKKFFSGPCMKLISAEIIGNRRFDVNFKNGEDSLFMFLISDKFNFICTTSQNAIYYRRIRQNSAHSSKKNMIMRYKNSFKIICSYFEIYFLNVQCYNFYFFLTRIFATLKGMFHN